MFKFDGFRLIAIINGNIDGYVVADATVDYQPDIKYRIEKKRMLLILLLLSSVSLIMMM